MQSSGALETVRPFLESGAFENSDRRKLYAAAVKLLAEHKIHVDQVVSILPDGKGGVQLYIQ